MYLPDQNQRARGCISVHCKSADSKIDFAEKVGSGNERHLHKKSRRLPHLAKLGGEDRDLTLEAYFKKVFQL